MIVGFKARSTYCINDTFLTHIALMSSLTFINNGIFIYDNLVTTLTNNLFVVKVTSLAT